MIYLTSTNELAIIAAEARISLNCGLVNAYGTTSWDGPPKKAVNEDLWFISKPPVSGWGNVEQFTQAQMMSGVNMTGIIEQERNSDWFAEEVG